MGQFIFFASAEAFLRLGKRGEAVINWRIFMTQSHIDAQAMQKRVLEHGCYKLS